MPSHARIILTRHVSSSALRSRKSPLSYIFWARETMVAVHLPVHLRSSGMPRVKVGKPCQHVRQ